VQAHHSANALTNKDKILLPINYRATVAGKITLHCLLKNTKNQSNINLRPSELRSHIISPSPVPGAHTRTCGHRISSSALSLAMEAECDGPFALLRALRLDSKCRICTAELTNSITIANSSISRLVLARWLDSQSFLSIHHCTLLLTLSIPHI